MTIIGTRLGRILHYVLLAMLAIIGVAIVAGAVALVMALVAPGLWPADATIRGANGAVQPLTDTGDRALACLFLIGGCALVAAVLVPLMRLMRSAAAGTPFVAANVGRLRVIAGVFGLFAVAKLVVPLASTPGARAMFGMGGPSLDLGPVLMALTMLVLSEVFREGVRLREENEGTI